MTAGLLSFDDRRRPSDFATRLEPINFELQNFTTGVDGGRFTFTGRSKLDERIEWHGHVAVNPIESDGEFQIAGLQAHTIWSYLEDQLNFQVPSGKIDVSATYKFSLQDQPDLKVDVSKVALTDLTVRPKEGDVDWITVPQLLLSGTTLDLEAAAGAQRLFDSDRRQVGDLAGTGRIGEFAQARRSAGAGRYRGCRRRAQPKRRARGGSGRSGTRRSGSQVRPCLGL